MKLLGGKYIPSKNLFGIDEIILPKHTREFYLKWWYKLLQKDGKTKGKTYKDFVSATAKTDTKTLRFMWVNSINVKYGKPYLIYDFFCCIAAALFVSLI
ncbi:MAG: hypothetical protein LBN95_12960 [Prevotellaceae bacterium]|jgi:hypothetical protein|nr:hypothetical protein [Prevotellaceae bacterium]